MRIEPPASLPCASATRPAATAAALPPDEPPGVSARVVRIARRAVALGLGDGPLAPLGRVGLADDDRPGGAQPGHGRGVDVRRPLAERAARVGRSRRPSVSTIEVLDRDRHAGERARVAGGDGVGLRPRALRAGEHERVVLVAARSPRAPRRRSSRALRRPSRMSAACSAALRERGSRRTTPASRLAPPGASVSRCVQRGVEARTRCPSAGAPRRRPSASCGGTAARSRRSARPP